MSGSHIFFWFLCRSFQGNNGTDQQQSVHSERPQQEVLSRLAVTGEGVVDMHWTRADLGVVPEGGPSSPFCLGISLFCKHVSDGTSSFVT